MTGRGSIDLTITSAERVDPGGPMLLVRVSGAGVAPADLALVVDDGDQAHRVGALPGPAPAGSWGAGFAVPRELLAGSHVSLALDPGGAPLVALPPLRDREVAARRPEPPATPPTPLPAEPLDPEPVEAAVETPPARPRTPRPRSPRRTAPLTAALTPTRGVRRRVDALLAAPFDGYAFGDSRPETPGRWQRVLDETNRRVGLLRDALGPRRDDD